MQTENDLDTTTLITSEKPALSESERYEQIKKIWRLTHRKCEFGNCQKKADRNPHHIRGRLGSLLCDTRFWMAVCRNHHNWIHANIAKARELGYYAELGLWDVPVPHQAPAMELAWMAGIWFENQEGVRCLWTQEQLANGGGPDPAEWPFAKVCFALQVTEKLYKRRLSDGGYGNEDLIGEGTTSFNGELAVAIVVQSRGKIDLRHAIYIASQACERCTNILAFQHDLGWGYPPFSVQAIKTRTQCRLCSR